MADPAPSAFKYSLGSGVLLGKAKELVYQGGTLLSELDWQLQPAYYMRGRVSVDLWGFASLVSSLEAGIPAVSGRMIDQDYLNLDSSVTNYSESTAQLDNMFRLTYGIQRDFILLPNLTMGLAVTGNSVAVSWAAIDGYYQYPPESAAPYTPWSSTETKVPLYGTSSVYHQSYRFVSSELSFTYQVSTHLTISAGVGYSPWVFFQDDDTHFLRSVEFTESLNAGVFFNPHAGFEVAGEGIPSFKVNVGFLSLGGFPLGSTTSKDLSTGKATLLSSLYSAGAALEAFDLSIAIDSW